MNAIHTILHPTDFSESAAGAFSVATLLAREHQARVVVLHVYPLPVWQGERVQRRRGNGYEDELWQRIEQVQPPDPMIPVERRLVEGDAAPEILRFAADEGCDLIVMGTEGKGMLTRLLMGSVAQKVLTQARCPVITVHLPEAAAKPAPVETTTAAV